MSGLVEGALAATVLVVFAIVVFAVALRVGMLLGRRLDRSMEMRAAADRPAAADQEESEGE